MEALKGVKTVAEIAAENGVHPVQVTQWKREMQEGAAQLFERSSKSEQSQEAEKARLERKVGQLVVEVDWLQKSAGSWGLIHEKDHGGHGPSPTEHPQTMPLTVDINRNRLKAPASKLAEADYQLMRRMDEIALQFP